MRYWTSPSSPPLPESLRDGGLSTASFGPRGTLADNAVAGGRTLTDDSERAYNSEGYALIHTVSFPVPYIGKSQSQPFTHRYHVSCFFSSSWRWTCLHTRDGIQCTLDPSTANDMTEPLLTSLPAHTTVPWKRAFYTHARTGASRKFLPEESDFGTSSDTPRFLTISLIFLQTLYSEKRSRRNLHPRKIIPNNARQISAIFRHITWR